MTDTDVLVRPLGRPGDLGWVLQAHGELYAAEYGWATEAVTARILADYAETAGSDAGTDYADPPDRPAREAAWIAERDGVRVGCVFLVRVDETEARLRLLLVDPAARGHRLGARLVECCVSRARELGYERLVLWTNEPLAAARRLYLAAGFTLTAEESHHAFGPELRGQEYALELRSCACVRVP